MDDRLGMLTLTFMRNGSRYLVHSSRCRYSMCSQPYCIRLQKLLLHTRECEQRQSGTCIACKLFANMCIIHVCECKEENCQFRNCSKMKQKLRGMTRGKLESGNSNF